MSILGEMLLLIAGAVLLTYSLVEASQKADDNYAELLCRGFNAIRFKTNVDVTIKGVSVATINPTPRVCRTIDKKDVPSSDYVGHINGPKEGAMAEIRDMTARCWWMWLEGQKPNMFEQGAISNTVSGNPCFICYTFALDKKAESFSYGDFSSSMAKPYYAIDSSEKCAPGYGGKCLPECSGEEKAMPSTNCKEPGKNKCCISKYPKDECKNKGGICDRKPIDPKTYYYPKWSCQEDNCYVDPKNVVSYLDYIQGTKGVELGEGKILTGDDEGFHSGTKYAITLVSPGQEWTVIGTGGLGLATVGTAALTVVGVVYAAPAVIGALGVMSGISLITQGTVVGIGATGFLGHLTSRTGKVNDINYIMISKYDTVKDKCSIEASSGAK